MSEENVEPVEPEADPTEAEPETPAEPEAPPDEPIAE